MKILHTFSLAILLTLASPIALAEWALVANESVQQESFTQTEVKRLFFGRITKWAESGDVKLCYVSGSKSLSAYLDEHTTYSPRKYKSYWNRKVFSGDLIGPKTFRDFKAMSSYVKNTRGAICIADKKTIMKTMPTNIRAVND